MHPAQYNLNLVQCMLQELEAYLLSKELFWPLSCSPARNDPPFPRLTLGTLSLASVELDAQEDSLLPAQRPQLRAMQRTHEETLRQWRVAAEAKAAREIKARIRLWDAFLEDFWREGLRAGDYSYEVRNRVILEHLVLLTEQDDQVRDDLQQIAALDRKLSERFQPGDFLWEDPLRRTYPQAQFPFLYGKPRPPRT